MISFDSFNPAWMTTEQKGGRRFLLQLKRGGSRAAVFMDTESLRYYGHKVVDWMVEYLTEPGSCPVPPRLVSGGSSGHHLPTEVPVQPELMEHILMDVQRLVMPGAIQWKAADVMGYLALAGSAPALLGEMFDATFTVTHLSSGSPSPGIIELEQITLDWLRQMLGLPASLFAMFHHNFSILHALLAAREALPHVQIAQKGLSGREELPPLRLYASQEAHISIDKAAMLLGIGREGVRRIGVDDSFRMDVDALVAAIEEDLQAGYLPFAVVATVGSTTTTSIDPVARIAAICKRYKLWLHVDATYAGAAAIVPDKRWILAGCDRADSLTISPQHWFFPSFADSIFFTSRLELVKSTLSLVPHYLHEESDVHDDGTCMVADEGSLPYRFPALKLWMAIRSFGQEGLIARITEHCRRVHWLARSIDITPCFERMAPVPLSVICFRAHPTCIDDEAELDALNERIMRRINAAGRFFLSHTRLRGIFTLRVAIPINNATEAYMHGLWREIQEALRAEMEPRRARDAKSTHKLLHMLSLPSRLI